MGGMADEEEAAGVSERAFLSWGRVMDGDEGKAWANEGKVCLSLLPSSSLCTARQRSVRGYGNEERTYALLKITCEDANNQYFNNIALKHDATYL